MVMKNIPFDTTANPSSCHTDICRFDTVLMVEYIITICLIYSIEEPSTNGWQDAEFYIFVFKIQGLIGDDFPVTGHIVIKGIRINASTGALIRPIAVKNRGYLCWIQEVGGKVQRSFPRTYFFLGTCAANRYECKYGYYRYYSFNHCVVLFPL